MIISIHHEAKFNITYSNGQVVAASKLSDLADAAE